MTKMTRREAARVIGGTAGGLLLPNGVRAGRATSVNGQRSEKIEIEPGRTSVGFEIVTRVRVVV